MPHDLFAKAKIKLSTSDTISTGSYLVAVIDEGTATPETDESNNQVIMGPLP